MASLGVGPKRRRARKSGGRTFAPDKKGQEGAYGRKSEFGGFPSKLLRHTKPNANLLAHICTASLRFWRARWPTLRDIDLHR
jgi:hypothetical protein